MGSLPLSPHLLLFRPSPGFASPVFTTYPCPFSPSPSYCEVRILCLRHFGLLPWKQGRIKAGARSAGIRPLCYLSSRLSGLPQGPGSQPQAPRLVRRQSAARPPPGSGQGQRGLDRARQPAQTWEGRQVDADAGTAGGGARRVSAWSPALPGPWGPLPARQPRGGAAGLPQRRRQLCSALR